MDMEETGIGKTDKISVVVPVYNAEKDIDRLVDTLLSQTYPNLEIILVDDGSKDQSGVFCDAYAQKYGNVFTFHQENAGSSAARNTGLRHATGDYIAFCDSDDYVEIDMYERLHSAAKAHPSGVIFQILTCYESTSGEILKEAESSSGDVVFHPAKDVFHQLMLHKGDASFCTKLIRANFMKNFAFPEGKLNEDFELLLRMLQQTDGVYSVETLGYHIVLSDVSNTRGTFKREFYDAMIANSDTAYKLAEEKYPESITAAKRFCLFQRLDYLLHIPVKEMRNNPVCDGIITYIRSNKAEIESNPFLSEKEKKNLKILMKAPRLSKRAHGLYMKLKKPGKTVIYTGAKEE